MSLLYLATLLDSQILLKSSISSSPITANLIDPITHRATQTKEPAVSWRGISRKIIISQVLIIVFGIQSPQSKHLGQNMQQQEMMKSSLCIN